jgi:uncharacterized membrane protein
MSSKLQLKTRERFWFWSLVLLALLAHSIWQSWLASWVVAPLYLAITMSWILRKPFWPVLVIGLIAELFTTLPPGMVLSACALPLLLNQLTPRLEVDISVRFLLSLGLSVTLQVLILASYDAWQIGVLPIALLWPSFLGTTLAAFITTNLYYYYLPWSGEREFSSTRRAHAIR